MSAIVPLVLGGVFLGMALNPAVGRFFSSARVPDDWRPPLAGRVVFALVGIATLATGIVDLLRGR